MATGVSTTATEEDPPDLRIRTLTEKGQDAYEEERSKWAHLHTAAWRKVEQFIEDNHDKQHNLEELRRFQKTLCLMYGEYRVAYRQFKEFLLRTRTVNSLIEEEKITSSDKEHDKEVNFILSNTDKLMLEVINSEGSVKSRSSRSSRSGTSSRANEAKAKAKAALVRKALIVKETALLKKKVDIEAEIRAFKEEEIMKAAEAEIEVYEQETMADELSFSHDIHVPEIPKHERTLDYVKSLNNEQIKTESQEKELSEISRFLLRKELLLSSLTKFDDKPENYPVWKASFKSVTHELGISVREELDLLVKWLGPESTKNAISARASSSSNPTTGVERLWERLWERLDERFGSPEIVDSSLRNKLENFPKLGVKDPKKLFELVDILDEIQNHMSDPKYSQLLSYFHTSRGIIPIINKLPHNLQEKWTTKAARYKSTHEVSYPPFPVLIEFLREMAKIKNDPGFCYESSAPNKASTQFKGSSVKPQFQRNTNVQAFKTTSVPVEKEFCHFHNVSGHALSSCRTFLKKPFSVRKKLLQEKRLCYNCCEADHRVTTCPHGGEKKHGGEKDAKHIPKETQDINTKCTLCKGTPGGRSCARIVLVNVFDKSNPENKVRMYALLDDQSNRTLAKPEFFEAFGGQFEETDFSISSCTGKIATSGRKAFNFVVESLDQSRAHNLPGVTECAEIPDIRDEIPTPEVAKAYSHLSDLANDLPELDDQAQVLLLIGRDLPEAHHVLQQRVGKRGLPFAQELTLGWVIIGESCLGRVHSPKSLRVMKTFIQPDGRASIMPPCENKFFVKEHIHDMLKQDVFVRTKNDDNIGLSAEDEEFLNIMEKGFIKENDGHWSAPLPLRSPRPQLPNNREQAVRRTHALQTSLKKNPEKQSHFVEFMARIFNDGYAEPAPPLRAAEECWYLPIFGVYHAKKGQIRVVFDSSAQYQGLSLNTVLLKGPDLMNSLLGVLMRFRRQPVAVMADIQQMFFQFKVHEEHRNLLRFIWFKDNDPNSELMEYRMKSQVFGNSPSPAIASYGLKKTAEETEMKFGSDMRNFVEKDFYVDDGLSSFADTETAIDVLTRTQKALLEGGKLRLHKIVSNDPGVMKAFSKDDLAKELQDLSLSSECLPTQRSLGMNWNLNADCFTYSVSKEEKPFTRRGVLSTVNSLYDPLGFVAPVVNQGRILMREMMSETVDWDKPLPDDQAKEWASWKESLRELEQLQIPRMYVQTNPCQTPEIHIFSDASEKAISAVAYMRTLDDNDVCQVGFVLGKSKVAPKAGTTIPRLELCAAVTAVELAETISAELNLPTEQMKFYTDSRVILGYLHNKERRFYIYVQNRVSRILKSTTCQQWHYISTDDNPADQGTRPIHASLLSGSKWLNGPDCLRQMHPEADVGTCELQSPKDDKEIRPVVHCLKVSIPEKRLGLERFESIGTWKRLIRVAALLKKKARTLKAKEKCGALEVNRPELLTEAERFIIREAQHEVFSEEITCLLANQRLPRNSTVLALDPFLDDHQVLRVGGRLKNANELRDSDKSPIILPKGHFVSKLVADHYHEKVQHQGHHFTEGAIRSAGFWIVGVKRLVRSIIRNCVKCRKLRGKSCSQIMSDLPEDRVTQSPPFSSVGVDVFGPWEVVTRRTRGGAARSKRWAVLYTCLTSRGIHIEVIEEMSTSSFINATRRFTAIRGPVQIFRSDRGTNFVGATDCMKIEAINVEDRPVQNFLDQCKTRWIFNSPHSSHMGGVWERLIGVVRRILDSMLADLSRDLTHETLTTFMAEICSIVNARPLVQVSTDPENPVVLSPAMLLTQKPAEQGQYLTEVNVKDMYKAQWRRVQCLSDIFWKRWKAEFLQTLQHRKKWPTRQRETQVGDVILMVEDGTPRNSWPLGVVEQVFPSKDGHVRKVSVKVGRTGAAETRYYTRPITKLITLIESEDQCE